MQTAPENSTPPLKRNMILGQQTVHSIDVNPACFVEFTYNGQPAACSSGPGPGGSRTYHFEPPLVGPGELLMRFNAPADRTSPADAADVATARASLLQWVFDEQQLKTTVSLAPQLPPLPVNVASLTPEQTEKRLAIRHVTFERLDSAGPWYATHITPLPA